MAQILLCAWLSWCIFNVGLLLASPWLTDGRRVFTNGFVTVFPQFLRDGLTAAEQAAFLAHEQGHIHHRHALKNLLCVCLFMGRNAATAQDQELEADDYAAARGHAPALASALRKLSVDPFDDYRARRLEAL